VHAVAARALSARALAVRALAVRGLVVSGLAVRALIVSISSSNECLPNVLVLRGACDKLTRVKTLFLIYIGIIIF